MQTNNLTRWLIIIAILLSLGLAFAQGDKDQFGFIPGPVQVGKYPKMGVPFDLKILKSRWLKRILAIKASGQLPIIDIESCYTPDGLDVEQMAELMDSNGVALVAYSPEVKKEEYRKNKTVWLDDSRRLLNIDPWRYIPVTTGGTGTNFGIATKRFLKETIKKAKQGNYPLLGEFFFKHYTSPRAWRRGEIHDTTIPINSTVGEQLFSYAEKTGLPFQIHYEIEDNLLPPLEQMLRKHPKAKVVWCHLAQIRYSARAKNYSPAYVRKLIEAYPNLYFDLAFGGPGSRYPGSGEYHATIWDRSSGRVKQEWVTLIAQYPWRFLAALDLGQNMLGEIPEKVRMLRIFIDNLPEAAREIVAYKAAWKLLFNEDI